MNSILSPFNRIKVREPSLIVSEEYYYIRYCTIYIASLYFVKMGIIPTEPLQAALLLGTLTDGEDPIQLTSSY
jgi:hypothetical protein